MQVTIGANCWDGARKKSLSFVETEGIVPISGPSPLLSKIKTGAKRLNHPKVRAVIGFTIPLVLLAHGLPPIGLARAFAATPADAVPVMSEAVQSKILHAFDPIIHMVQSLSYPIAGLMIATGCLFIMIGNRDKGMDMLKNAAIGYILVQLTPLFLELLVGVGGSL